MAVNSADVGFEKQLWRCSVILGHDNSTNLKVFLDNMAESGGLKIKDG